MAGRQCSICTHPRRAAIDAALQDGSPYGAIASHYRISPDAVGRHTRLHLRAGGGASGTSTAIDIPDAAHGTPDVLAVLVETVPRLTRLLARLERQGQGSAFVAACRELRQVVSEIGRLTGSVGADGKLTRMPVGLGRDTNLDAAKQRLLEKVRALSDRA